MRKFLCLSLIAAALALTAVHQTAQAQVVTSYYSPGYTYYPGVTYYPSYRYYTYPATSYYYTPGYTTYYTPGYTSYWYGGPYVAPYSSYSWGPGYYGWGGGWRGWRWR
jgi:hypothetical protein